MARDYYDESKEKKKKKNKNTQGTGSTTSSQSSSSSSATDRVNEKASKSTFLGGSTYQAQQDSPTTPSTSSSSGSSSSTSLSSTSSTGGGGTSSSNRSSSSTQSRVSDRTRTSTFLGGSTYQQNSGSQSSTSATSHIDKWKEQKQKERAQRRTDRRNLAQAQKSGDFERASKLRDEISEPSERRAKINEWDKDISDTIGQTLKQGKASDIRYLNQSMQGITKKDAFLYTTESQRKKADEKVARTEAKYSKQLDEANQSLEDIKSKHGYLGQRALEAVSSGTGMAVDLGIGALTGGASLFHMKMRSTGGTMGQVQKKADALRSRLKDTGYYTDSELDEMFKDVEWMDLLNAEVNGDIEGISELFFRGFGPVAKYVGGSSIAEKIGSKLLNKAGGKATSGILKNALKGTAEEIAEEEMAGPAEAWAANAIYGNKFQGYQEDALKRSLADQSNTLRSQIQSPEDAQMAAARLSSPAFMEESIETYMQAGHSREEATELAEMSRDYLSAALSGDVDTMKAAQDAMVEKLAGGENSMKEKFTPQDAIDAAVSTAMMTLPTGMPGALSTQYIGNAYKENVGLDAVRKQAELIKNWGDEEDAKAAEGVIENIDNGGDMSGTQVYEVIQKAGQTALQGIEEDDTKLQVAAKEMKDLDLRVSPINADGSLGPQTQQTYIRTINDTIRRYDTLEKIGEGPGYSKEDVVLGADIGASFNTGVITSEQINDLVSGSDAVKDVFHDVTGVDINQFASNKEMRSAFMAQAAHNLVNSARIEQAAWNDEVKGGVADSLSKGIGGEGDKAVSNILESVDPRDRSHFLLTADVARSVYDRARNTEESWDDMKWKFRNMYPSVDVNAMKDVYKAAKEDKLKGEAYYGKVITSGEKATRSSLNSAATGYVAGKFTDKRQNKEGKSLKEESLLKAIASGFGINVEVVDDLSSVRRDKNGNAVLDEEGNPIYTQDNGLYNSATNTLIINAHPDTTRTITQTASHELTHHIAVHAPKEYVKLQKYIMDAWYRQDAAGYDRAIKNIQAAYKAQKNQELSNEQALEELIANGAADFDWSDEKFIEDVTVNEPTLAEQIINAIKEVLRKIRSILASGDVIDEASTEALYSKAIELDTVRSLWVKAAQMARKNRAQQAINEWQDKADKAEIRHSIAQEKRKNDEKLTQKQFNDYYYAHKLLRDDADIESIKENGFKGTNAVNVMPADINDYEGYARDMYGVKEGQTVLLVPREYVKGDSIVNGFKPKEYEIVTAGRNLQPYYELYSKAYDEAHETRYSVSNLSALDYQIGETLGDEPIGVHIESTEGNSINIRYSIPTEINAYIKGDGRETSVRLMRDGFMKGRGKEKKAVNAFLDLLGDHMVAANDLYKYVSLSDVQNATVTYRRDADGNPTSVIMSCQVQNGEYEINYDFSTICKKRKAFQDLIEQLFARTDIDTLDLTEENIFAINQALEKYGFEVACPICFVEARRYANKEYADKIISTWNAEVEKVNPDAEYFDFANADTSKFDYAAINEALKKAKMTDKMDFADKCRVLVNSGEVFQKKMQQSDILTNKGVAGMKAMSNEQNSLFGYMKQSRGASAPKEIVSFNAYNGEIEALNETYKGMDLDKFLYTIGGARLQSFSDFQIENVYDYIQLIAGMAARKLPAHAYTKEVSFAKLFGMTGMKVNLSLVCDVDPDIDNEHAGLTKDADGNWVYNLGSQSFKIEDARELQSDPRYSKNVGTIMVGMSDAHIIMALNDSDVRYVIPYHKSGLPGVIQDSTHLDKAKDYTAYQNTCELSANGIKKLQKAGYEADIKAIYEQNGRNVKKTMKAINEMMNAVEFTSGDVRKATQEVLDDDGNPVLTKKGEKQIRKLSSTGDFNVYDNVAKTKNPRKTAENYMAYCFENGYLPLFFQFAENKNYYKMIFDFNVYDCVTEKYAPQGAVKNIFPGLDLTKGESDATEFLGMIDGYLNERNEFYKEQNPKFNDVITEVKSNILTDLKKIDEPAEDIERWSVSDNAKQLDDAYMDAVNSGNMEEAQRLVDEAAKMAMPNSKLIQDGKFFRMWHHTNTEFTSFLPGTSKSSGGLKGIYFTPQEHSMMSNLGDKHGAYYLNVENLKFAFGVKEDKEYVNKLLEMQEGVTDREELEQINRQFKEETGVDAFFDWQNGWYNILTPEQIKSADTVTYAEDGSVIPLSERFDPNNNDIRYSMPTQDTTGKILTDGQMEYFQNSQARDSQGRLVPVYHTTNKGGFTIFDPMKSDDHRSLFFADDWDTSQTYGNYANSRFYYFDIDNIDDVKKYLDAYSPDRYFVTQEQFDQAGGWEADMLDFENVTNGEQSDFAKYLDNPDGYIAIIGVPDYSPDNTSYADTWVMAKSPDELVRELHNHFGWQRDNYRMGTQHGYYACYLNLEDPYIIDAHGDNWNEIHLDDYDDDVTFNTREIAEMAMDMDFDGVIIRNLVDHGGKSPYDGMFDYSDIYIAFSSNQVKDINNENPTENPDIRFSLADDNDVMTVMQNKAETTDDLWSNDPDIAEGRVRYSMSKRDYINGVTNEWNPAWKTEGHVLKESAVKKDIKELITSAMQNSNTKARYRQKLVDETLLVARDAFDKMQSDEWGEAADLLYDHAVHMVENLEFSFGNEEASEFERYKEMRDYLRETKIYVPEDDRGNLDWAAYRDDNFGSILLGNEGIKPDKVWGDLHEKWPEYFTEDNKGDVQSIMEALEAAVKASKPITQAYSSEYCMDLAADLAADLYYIVRDAEAWKSLADRYDEKTKAMKQRHAEAMIKVKENHRQAIRDLKAEMKTQERTKLAEQKERLTDKYEQKISDLKVKQGKALKEQRQRSDAKIQQLKADRRKSDAERRYNKAHRELYNRVLNEYNTLTDMLLKPSHKDRTKNIPEQLRQPVAEMLAVFDLEKERSKKLEEKYRIPTRTQLDFRQLKDSLEKVAKEEGQSTEFETYFNYISEKITDIADKMDEMNTYTIDALGNEDIEIIKDMLAGLIESVKNWHQLEIDGQSYQAQQQCDKVGEGAKEHQNLYGKAKKYNSLRGFLDNIVNMGELTPIYFFRQLKGMYDMYRQIRKGFDSYVMNEQMIIDKIADILAPYYKTNRKGQRVQGSEIEEWRHSESAETFDLTYGTITLTVAQKMSMYCLAKREQAKGHMYSDNGGVVASEITAGSKIHKAEEAWKGKTIEYKQLQLTPADVDEIITTLTPEQMHIADELQKLMSDDMSELGNKTSMKMLGIRIYKEKEYFPIRIQGESKGKDLDNIGVKEKVRNPGFSNPLKENASNPIIIDDIFTVVAKHCNEMNLYASYAVPLTNFMKVYNGSVMDEQSGKAIKIQTVIKQTYGEKAIQYIDNFLDDINGNSFRRAGGLGDVLDKAMGQAKKAAVFANLRVALQQPTAIVRAWAVMELKYFKGVKPSSKETQEMWEHCPIALWKSWGYYDTHFGRDIEDVMMGKEISSRMDRYMSDIYGALDNMTWGMIWQAVKNEIEDTRKDLKPGSPEFFEACAERASYVFDSTQVVDSPFHRSNDMRDKNGFVKQMTSFMAEPTLSFNVLRQGIVDTATAIKKGDMKTARKTALRIFAVWVGQALTVAVAQSLVDALRRKGHKDSDDDEDEALAWYEEIMKYFTRNFGQNFIDDVMPYNNVYWIKDFVPGIINAIKGEYVYGQSNLVFQWYDSLTKGIQAVKKKMEKGEAYKKSWYDCLTEFFGGVGYGLGFPAKTVMRGVKNAFYWFNKITGADVFADDGTVHTQSILDSLAERMGYRKNESDSDVVSEKPSDKGKGETSEPKSADAKAIKKIVKAGIKEIGKPVPKTEQQMLREIEEKTVGYYGADRDARIWDIVGDGYTEYIANGDYEQLNTIRRVIEKAGGNVTAFDNKLLSASKTAYKKTMVDDPTDDQMIAQMNIRNYLLENGMTESEISAELVYKSDTARDLKAAFRMGNEDYIVDELVTLLRAGITREDIYKLYKYRNYGAKDYSGKYSAPEYRKSQGSYIWPTQGTITSGFGSRSAPTAGASSYHNAIDIGAPQGTPVVAADGGVIVEAGANGGYGNSVGIRHDDGTISYYNHLYAWNVKVGDTVAQGQQIGQVGSTGISTGPHLDFRLYKDGEYLNPEEYLNAS